ncbi:CinA family nicotinamide mononucleotide deamidase-related protein [Portibacter lacus]|uniref:CinA-like protein n=1 Tax=Portibacter lacus TaxID=1099794 RepID=A0AA37SUP6_9BACT|nr:CinA family nicotinamide mononucleotide deamidase-related protein [Portibacter lacus]GLR18543.1 CinA-like protein [Portibacter lacus]
MEAKIITIGDELLIGQVIDSNSAWLGAELEAINIRVTEIRSIQDTEDEIIKHLSELTGKTDVIILTGGLGPTKDDVTKKALANFLGVELEFNASILEQLTALFKRINIEVKESHKTQAYVPAGCAILSNKMGTAQGMWMEHNGSIIISMPGVPYEMKYIMENGGLEKLAALNNGNRIFHKTIMTAGWGETMIEEKILPIIDALPPHIKVAYLPGLGNVRIRVSSKSENDDSELTATVDQICNSLGNIVYGFDNIRLEEAIGAILLEQKLTLGTAESCTGGNVARMITSIAGSSAYYKGSIVSYANEIKTDLLGVQSKTLEDHGAVSKETVTEMVQGALRKLDVDVAIATSGIAGPGGGTPEKPVGTIWIAVGSADKVITHKLNLTKNRNKNITYTSIAALNMLRKFLVGQ